MDFPVFVLLGTLVIEKIFCGNCDKITDFDAKINDFGAILPDILQIGLEF